MDGTGPRSPSPADSGPRSRRDEIGGTAAVTQELAVVSFNNPETVPVYGVVGLIPRCPLCSVVPGFGSGVTGHVARITE